MKELAIVGNGPLLAGDTAAVSAADAVIRFNSPPAATLSAGMRTDVLVLANAGKPAQARLRDRDYQDGPVFSGAARIVLPYHPEVIARYHPQPNILSWLKGRRADWTEQCLHLCAQKGKPVEILSAEFYAETCAALGITPDRMQRLFPSSGILAICAAQDWYPKETWRTTLYGFGFQGWKRHDWAAERRLAESLTGSGRLAVTPIATGSAS